MALPETLDCGPCRLRPWKAGDAPSLARHANNRNVWRNLRDIFPHPYAVRDAEAYIAFAINAPAPDRHWAIDVEDEAVGALSILPGRDVERLSAEIGYWLGEDFWGRGIVTAAVRAAADAAFSTTDLVRLHAPVFAWNARSMRVLEKAGFVREAVHVRGGFKDGTLIDRVVYVRTRDDGRPYCAAPHPRPVLRQAVREDVTGIQRVRHAVRENRLTSRSSIPDAEVIDYIERIGRGWVVVDEANDVIGFAIGDARDGNIWALFVDPAHEGRGHGRRLHDEMVAWLFSRGLETLWLGTTPGTRAERFYRRAGWTEAGPAPGGELRFELRK
jgi:ribosomal-protein-alanine N-acetyltransferase